MTKTQVAFFPPGFHAEYGHTIPCRMTAAAYLELASPKHTNTGKGPDKCATNPKLANGSCTDEALKFAYCITKGKDK